MSVFPNAKYDDQVDSTVHALVWVTTPFPNQGFLEHYKKLANASDQGISLAPPHWVTS